MRGVRGTIALVSLALVVLLAGGLRPAAGQPDPTTAANGTPVAGLPGVSSEVLARAAPDAAPAEELAVGRATIAPGASIPPHEHPGTQVAAIVSGELTYTVLSGEVPVRRAGTTGTPVATAAGNAIAAGETVVLRPGDAITERPGALHTARNAGTEPVVIALATLFDRDRPRTIFAASPEP